MEGHYTNTTQQPDVLSHTQTMKVRESEDGTVEQHIHIESIKYDFGNKAPKQSIYRIIEEKPGSSTVGEEKIN
jgi:hypothetical protein